MKKTKQSESDKRPAALLTAWVASQFVIWPHDICMVEFGNNEELERLQKEKKNQVKEHDPGAQWVQTILVSPYMDEKHHEAFLTLLEDLKKSNPLALEMMQRLTAEIWRQPYDRDGLRFIDENFRRTK